MPTGALTPITRWQILDNGAPVAGAKLYTTLSGTSTPQATYSDSALTTPHTNPVVADAEGVLPVIYLAALAYRFFITTSAGVTVFPAQDNVYDFGQLQLAGSGGAALVGFIQAGASAVTRTSQAKMREQFSVTDFGDDLGNPTTNATSAFQAAMAALPSGGGDIILPLRKSGVTDYLITGLTMTKPIRFIGDCRFEASTGSGQGVRIISTTNAAIMTFATGSSQSSMEDISVVGNGSGVANNQNGIVIDCGGPAYLKNVQVRAAGGRGIKVTYMVQGNWERVKVDGSRSVGIDFDKGSAPAAMGQNVFISIAVDSVANGAAGIRLAGCQQGYWLGVSVFACTGDAFVYTTSADATSSKDNYFLGCHTEGNTGDSVVFNNGSQRNFMMFDSYVGAVTDNSATDSLNEVRGPLVIAGVTQYGGPDYKVSKQPSQSMRELTNSRVWRRYLDSTGAVEDFQTIPIVSHTVAGTVFNDDGADRDFRIESDTVPTAVDVDGATGKVTLGSGIVQIDSLPTSDPGVPGRLYRTSGDVKISI